MMKKAFVYFKYFFFIAYNWFPRLAFFTIYHEIKGERKYNLDTTGINDLKNLSVSGNKKNSKVYQGANYYLLEKIFDFLREEKANKNIVDIGCGKGRALVVAAHYGFKKITGVEFAGELCEDAARNISHARSKFPDVQFNIICNDALDYKIESDTEVFFLFNPFNEVIMLPVLKNILRSVKENPREIFVVYINPVHEELFLSAGFEPVFRIEKFTYIAAVIYMYN